MLRTIIKYGGLALVIIGIILVMKNLFRSDADWNKDKKNNTIVNRTYYSATVSLLDSETKKFVSGAEVIVKDQEGNVISGWTTEDGTHLVPNLKKGTYTLIEQSAPEGYHLNDENVTFEIKNKDKEVVMYNSKMTAEEKARYEEEQRAKNTVSSEVGVDNTLSHKGIISVIGSVMIALFGVMLIVKKKEM